MKKSRKWVKRMAMTLAVLTCATMLSACGDNTAKSEDTDLVLRFVAMSDVHIGYVGDTNYKRFEKAMEAAYDYAGSQVYDKLDAVMVVGDMTNYGTESELAAFKSVLDKSLKEDTESLLITGNHEFFKEEGPEIVERWETAMGREINTHNVINGYHFINLSLTGYKDSTYADSLEWFEAELAAAAEDDPNKPIFVQHHYPIKGTVYGSNLWGTSKMTTIMRKYPQIISFSGHSHYPMNDPRSIWQGDYTALGCGTLAYYELEPGMVYGSIPPNSEQAAQYYIVEVHEDNSVTIKGYDVITEQFFDFEYTIEDPSDKSTFQYTNARRDEADEPVFPEGAEVTVESVEDTKVTLTIPQATDGECIHSYRFDFYIDGSKQSTASIWSEFYFLDMPKTLTQEFTGLIEGSYYTVEVTAIDSWGKESEKTISAEFSTGGEKPESLNPGDEIPTADVFDVQASEKGFADASEKKKEITNDGATIAYDETAKAFAGDFGGSQSLFVSFESGELISITQEVSLEVGFVLDSFTDPYADVVGCMQNGGYGFEVNAEASALEFWVHVNGSYQVLSVPIETGKYYEAIGAYNGRNATLYLNGECVTTVSCSGPITYASATGAHAFRVGSDITADGAAEACFDGKITHARLYSFGITGKQAENLYEEK